MERRQKTDLLKERNTEVAPVLQPRCEAALKRSEGGDVDAWLPLLREMSVDEGGTHYMDLRQMDIEKLPGWMRAAEDMRARTVAAAKRFLMRTDFRDMDWFPSKQIPNGASLG